MKSDINIIYIIFLLSDRRQMFHILKNKTRAANKCALDEDGLVAQLFVFRPCCVECAVNILRYFSNRNMKLNVT